MGAFDYQLGGAYEPAPEVQLVARDRTDAPADGLYSICYINGFQTQPGEQELWPADTLLTIGGELVFDSDWPDEVLLDTSTNAKREAVLGIVGPWIEGCARDGFDAVEFDNLDSFTRSHGVLTIDDGYEKDPAVVALIAHGADGAVPFVVAVNPAAVDLGLSANDLVKALGAAVDGRGGGKADQAQGSGRNPAGIDAALAALRAEIARS